MDYHSFVKDLIYYAETSGIQTLVLKQLKIQWCWIVITGNMVHYYSTEE